jgi:hypothetical protein
VAPHHPAGAHAHEVGEQPLEGSDAERDPLRELAHRGQRRILGREGDGAGGERQRRVGLGGQQRRDRRFERPDRRVAPAGGADRRDQREVVQAGQRAGGKAAVSDLGDRAAQERPQPARREARGHDLARARQRARERRALRAVQPCLARLHREVRGRVREGDLPMGRPAAQVPAHRPEPRDVGRERRGGLPAAQREGVGRRRPQHPRGRR